MSCSPPISSLMVSRDGGMVDPGTPFLLDEQYQTKRLASPSVCSYQWRSDWCRSHNLADPTLRLHGPGGSRKIYLVKKKMVRFITRKKNENDDLMVYPIFIQTALDALIHSLIHSPLVSWSHPNLWPWQVLSSWKCSLHLSCSEDVNGSQRIFSRQTSLELGGPLMIHSAKSDILSP